MGKNQEDFCAWKEITDWKWWKQTEHREDMKLGVCECSANSWSKEKCLRETKNRPEPVHEEENRQNRAGQRNFLVFTHVVFLHGFVNDVAESFPHGSKLWVLH